jgi:hypothetical protein
MDSTLNRYSLQFALGFLATNRECREAFTSDGWLQEPETSGRRKDVRCIISANPYLGFQYVACAAFDEYVYPLVRCRM